MRANPRKMLFEDGSWGSCFTDLKSLKRLQIELETIDAKKEALDAIAAFAQTWMFPMKDEMCLILDSTRPLQKQSWTGSSRFTIPLIIPNYCSWDLQYAKLPCPIWRWLVNGLPKEYWVDGKKFLLNY